MFEKWTPNNRIMPPAKSAGSVSSYANRIILGRDKLKTRSLMKKSSVFLSMSLLCTITSASPLADKITNASGYQIKSIAKSVAESLAKDTPTQIDSATRMMGVSFVSSTNTFIYSYETTVQPNPNYMRPRLINGVCSNEILRALANKSITFQYYYSAPNGTHLFTQNVVARDCNVR